MTDDTDLQNTVLDQKQPAEKRIAAGRELLLRFQGIRSHYDLFKIFCQLFVDEKEDTNLRLLAVNALEKCSNVNYLVRGVKDARVRAEAVAALKRLGPSKLQDALQRDLSKIQSQLDSGKVDINGLCTIANLPLTHGRDPEALQMLQTCLLNADVEVRMHALRSLIMLGETELLPAALKDPHDRVRATAAEYCGYYGFGALSQETQRLITDLLQDASLLVQQSAQSALKRLGLLKKPKPKSKSSEPAKKSDEKASKYKWRQLMEQWSRLCLKDDDYLVELPDQVVESSWLGFAAATAYEIAELEKRIGMKLPLSYKEFLELTNGWRRISPAIDRLWSARDVDFFAVRNKQWIDAYCSAGQPEISPQEHLVYGEKQDCCAFRTEYLKRAVEISDVGDSAILLLNPQVVNADGEWEAWFFANWLPGAQRYESFWDLMQAQFREESSRI